MLPTIFRELSSVGAEVYWAEWDIYIYYGWTDVG